MNPTPIPRPPPEIWSGVPISWLVMKHAVIVADAVQVEALKKGQVTKPVVAWVSGTCAKLFKSEVQFGHAGAKSGGDKESAQVSLAP